MSPVSSVMTIYRLKVFISTLNLKKKTHYIFLTFASSFKQTNKHAHVRNF